jgi:hypothetical protein
MNISNSEQMTDLSMNPLTVSNIEHTIKDILEDIIESIINPKVESNIEPIKEADMTIGDINKLKKIISHIESNILGKIPEIKRLYSHISLIFQMINNKLGYRTYLKVKIELEQLKTVFKYDISTFQGVILKKDKRLYNEFRTVILRRINDIDRLNTSLNSSIKTFKLFYTKLVQRELSNVTINKENEIYIRLFRKMNCIINMLKGNNHDIHYILVSVASGLRSSRAHLHSKHRDHLCASNVFGLKQDEYKELIESDTMLILHRCSRRYNCELSLSSFEMFIDKTFNQSYPKIIEATSIELYMQCPCKKIDGKFCNQQFSLDRLLIKYDFYEKYKSRIIERKKTLVKELYGVDIYIKCPKPDCPNGDGFTYEDTVRDISNGVNSIDISPIHKCNLCNTVWCAKCDKSHPGRICPEDDEELDENIKRCPKCKLLTSRDGGCFHMNCTNCGVHWCWECNHFTPQADAYTHVCVSGNWLPNT